MTHIFSKQSSLNVVLCVGETDEEKESNKTNDVLKAQLKSVIEMCKEGSKKLIIAYEPRWAIGTGKIPTFDSIQSTMSFIQSLFSGFVPPVIYGGSANKGNCNDIAKLEACSGFLIGGASLKPDEFEIIIKSMIKSLK